MFTTILTFPIWYWLATLAVLLLVLWVVVIVQGVRMGRVQRRYRQWVGRSGTDLNAILPDIMERLNDLSERLTALDRDIRNIEEQLAGTVRTVKVIRYKAFSDLGGDLSFSAVWLDGRGDGVIISSIYGRDESRTYAKPVHQGRSSYPLSEEEQSVLAQAIQPATAGERGKRRGSDQKERL
ncbi:MAG: DUF4446 family protein [Alicyclobacillaceae bacterium]|nr:DUF4446 family protein [Alicyclobacillaceae bacterium]